jgi:tetratricopeptide (TPR) repeat protein
MIKAVDEYPSPVTLSDFRHRDTVAEASPPPTIAEVAPVPDMPQPKPGTARKAVGFNLEAAIRAAKNKDYDTARRFMALAENAPNKTHYEALKISEVWAFIYGQQRDYKALLKSYEDMLANSNNRQLLSKEQSAILTDKSLAQLAAMIGDNPRAIAFSESWLKDHSDDAENLRLLTQSYYRIRNYRSCLDTATHSVLLAENAHQTPSEASLQFMRSCADSAGNQDVATLALEKLCQYYPKPAYWTSYIRAKSRGARDFPTYYWNRLSVEAAGIEDPNEYSFYAEVSRQILHLPASGARVMEQGIAKDIFPPKMRTRIERILLNCSLEAQSARERLPQLVQETTSDPTGQKDFEVGLIYLDNQQFDNAIASLSAALKKAHFKDTAQAQMALGFAHLAKGDRDKARVAFSIVGLDPILKAVTQAWIVRSYN